MITYVNSKEAKLFELAAEALGETSLSLDQYLSRLADLKAISPRYVRLPLYEDGHEDEDIFEIDANARTIKVPASFNKNGVGVVSDELAETIWFKINRYFDIKDFGKAVGHEDSNNLKDQELHILIQWEAPDGAKGASWAYAIDADTDPDHIYFGWALTAEHLTAKAGNIKFAIRIMQYDADGIAYSFATQAASIVVKAGLSFDVTDDGIEIESVADKIASRLMGGEIAYCPVFEQDLQAYLVDLTGEAEHDKLEVVAVAPEGSEYDAVAYKWYKKGANDKEFKQLEGEYKPALTVTSSGEYYVVVFGMRHIVDAKEYIYDGVSEEVLYTQEDLDAYKAEHGTDAEPNWAVGDVKVPAGTRYDNFKYHTSIASSKSTICEIPAPIKLAITKEMAEHLVLADSPVLVLEVERQMIEDEPVGIVSLKVEKTASAEKGLDLEHAEFLPVSEASEGSEAVTEAWIWNGEEYASEEAAVTAKGEAEGEIEHREAKEAVPAVAGIDYRVDGSVITVDMANAEEGYYKITIINKLNGDQEETVSGVICRVVKPASLKAASISIVGTPGLDGRGSLANGNYLEVAVDLDGQLSDDIQYAWYIINTSKDPADTEPDELIANAKDAIYKPVARGSYYCVVTNIVENTEAKIITNDIEFA